MTEEKGTDNVVRLRRPQSEDKSPDGMLNHKRCEDAWLRRPGRA